MQPLRAIGYKLLSVALLMTMSALIKATADEVPTGEAVFFRSFFALPVILVWLAVAGSLREGLGTVSPRAHLLRGVMGVAGMSLTFTALGMLPLPEITAILYASPLLVVILAAMFLGEQVRAFRFGAVGLGLLGVLIVLSPRLGEAVAAPELRHSLGATLALGAALLSAMTQIFVRNMVRTETVSSIVFYFHLTATTLSLVTIPWGWVMPSPFVLMLLVSAGLLGGVGQILMTAAYRHADASLVAPFEYFSMLLALAFGYFVFHEVPTWTTLTGAALVILAGILIIWRERQLGLDLAGPRSARTPDG